ncbi:MAG TPA: transporter substrate-binding domain-containing protein, partial [Gaiellaceae bacterium]|nr:transporter substrate-binding domain-containing protein [Gaiellaceae bacterium]
MGSKSIIAAGSLALVAAVLAGSAGAARHASTLVFCSDTTYPPMEYLVGGTATGADVDIANAVAKQLGETAQIKTTGFDVIIPALLKKKCD